MFQESRARFLRLFSDTCERFPHILRTMNAVRHSYIYRAIILRWNQMKSRHPVTSRGVDLPPNMHQTFVRMSQDVRKKFAERSRNKRGELRCLRETFCKLSWSGWGFTKILRTSRTSWVGPAHMTKLLRHVWEQITSKTPTRDVGNVRKKFHFFCGNSRRTKNDTREQLTTLPNPRDGLAIFCSIKYDCWTLPFFRHSHPSQIVCVPRENRTLRTGRMHSRSPDDSIASHRETMRIDFAMINSDSQIKFA